MTDTMTTDAHNDDRVDRAVTLLGMLDAETREQVMGRMDGDTRDAIERRASAAGEGSIGAYAMSIAARRRLMRETMLSMHGRTLHDASTITTAFEDQEGTPDATASGVDPLEYLSEVHPAALVTALRGERPEVWALVLDRMTPPAREALVAYLDGPSRDRIREAQSHQHALPPQLLTTTLRAIRHTVVPHAMREHHALMTARLKVPPAPATPGGTA